MTPTCPRITPDPTGGRCTAPSTNHRCPTTLGVTNCIWYEPKGKELVPTEEVEVVDSEVVDTLSTGFEWVEVIDPLRMVRTFKVTVTDEWFARATGVEQALLQTCIKELKSLG